MDFLESLDLDDTKDKKAHRVRSWYLYEQYKALEKHQFDAAQKLKDKSYQDRILRQELLERRARRTLYDQFEFSKSESWILDKSSSIYSARPNTNNDEFVESFSEQEDERVTEETEFDNYSQDLSTINCNIMNDSETAIEQKDNVSYSTSVVSVVANMVQNEDCEHKTANSFTTAIIVEDLNKKLEAVKQNIKIMESITKLHDDDQSSVYDDDDDDDDDDNDRVCLVESCKLMNNVLNDSEHKKLQNSLILIWSRVVSFAYQIVQQNHGNCYCDYSSQFLTAVLICDMLRRGVNIMCYHLQPYISPIKYANEESNSVYYLKSKKTKKSEKSTKIKKIIKNKQLRKSKGFDTCRRHAHSNYSNNTWQHCFRRRPSFELKKLRRASETLQGVTRIPYRDSSSSSSCRLPKKSKESVSKNVFRRCVCYNRTVNPMLEIARYIDNILKDMDH